MKKGSIGVARRYARALLDVALETGSADEVRRQLAEAVALLGEHKDLAGVLDHPAVSAERKRKIVAAVWGGSPSAGLVSRLLALLVERGRMPLLPQIQQLFTALHNAQRKVVAAQAVVAAPLDGAQEEALAGALRKASGLTVELATRVDPEILGGLMVKMGGRVYDGTVRAKLRSLRERLAGAPHS